MATELKGLKVKKVDFVDQGANPNAHVLLFKNKDGKPGDDKGNQTKPEEPKPEGMLKRFITVIGKHVGLKPEEIDATVEEIAKGGEAETFGEKMYEVNRRRITDEIWDICYALQTSLCSIVCDDEAKDNAQELMETSLTEFSAAISEAVKQWANGKTSNSVQKSLIPATEEQIGYMEYYKGRIEDLITKTADKSGKGEPQVEDTKKSKGEVFDMSLVDKSKMTPAERAFFEDIEKRYGEAGTGTGTETGEGIKTEPPVAKAAPALPVGTAATPPAGEALTDGAEDIYKGLHPAVAEELKMLKKRADDAEEKDLAEIAKKYEIIGKKPEELVPVLKSLKATGGTAYDEMISILDASVNMVNKAGVFSEIGKSGGYGGTEPDAWSKIEKKADEILQANPAMTRAAAIDTACQQNPQLVHEYESDK